MHRVVVVAVQTVAWCGELSMAQIGTNGEDEIMIQPEDWTPEDMYCGDEYVGPSKYGTEVKRCRMCDCEVEMSTDHGVCDSCASAMERGVEW